MADPDLCGHLTVALIAVKDLPPFLYSPTESVSENMLKSLLKVQFSMWLCGRTANFKQRLMLL